MIKALKKDSNFTLPHTFKNIDGTFKRASLFNLEHKHHHSRKLQSAVVEPDCGVPPETIDITEIPGISPALSMSYEISTTLTSACMKISVPFPNLNMNYNPDAQKATTASINVAQGITCNNCWAYWYYLYNIYITI
jgi:hypothetical protein